jgi:hypothetical protein
MDEFEMTIDTSRAVEIEASRAKLLGLAVIGVVMTALSMAIALHAFPKVQPGSLAEFTGYVGIPLFGACTLLALWRAFTAHGPVVTIAPQGIWDRRVAAEIIPWSAVKDIAVWKHRRQRYMVLMVDPAVEAGLHLTRMARWSRNANRALGADGLCVGSNDLKIGFEGLLSTSLAFARASPSSRAPVAQTEAAAGDGR